MNVQEGPRHVSSILSASVSFHMLIVITNLTCRLDTIGTYFCECNDGYTGNGLDRCIDKDECALGEDLCAENAACINNDGSFDCECKVGFNHAQSNPLELCLDLDECQDPNAYPCGDYDRKRCLHFRLRRSSI